MQCTLKSITNDWRNEMHYRKSTLVNSIAVAVVILVSQNQSARATEPSEVIGAIIGAGIGGVIGSALPFPPFSSAAGSAAGTYLGQYIGPVVAENPRETIVILSSAIGGASGGNVANIAIRFF